MSNERDFVGKVSSIVNVDIEELLEELRAATVANEVNRARLAVAKAHEKVLLASLRQGLRKEARAEGRRITIAEVEDAALSSDDYEAYHKQYRKLVMTSAESGALADQLNKQYDIVRSLIGFARAEMSSP